MSNKYYWLNNAEWSDKAKKEPRLNALQSVRLDIVYILKYFGWAFLALRSDIWNFLVFQSLEHLRCQRRYPSCSSGLADSSRKPSAFSVLNIPAIVLASSWDANVPFCLLSSFLPDRNKDLDADGKPKSQLQQPHLCLLFAVSPVIRTLWLWVTPVKWLSHATYHLEKGIDKL